MEGYEEAAIHFGQSLAFLNFGQSLIIYGPDHRHGDGRDGRPEGELTVGDFVMVNAYMIQITMPLGFLGTVYPRRFASRWSTWARCSISCSNRPR